LTSDLDDKLQEHRQSPSALSALDLESNDGEYSSATSTLVAISHDAPFTEYPAGESIASSSSYGIELGQHEQGVVSATSAAYSYNNGSYVIETSNLVIELGEPQNMTHTIQTLLNSIQDLVYLEEDIPEEERKIIFLRLSGTLSDGAGLSISRKGGSLNRAIGSQVNPRQPEEPDS